MGYKELDMAEQLSLHKPSSATAMVSWLLPDVLIPQIMYDNFFPFIFLSFFFFAQNIVP